MKIVRFLNENVEKLICVVLLAVMIFSTTCQIIFRFAGMPLAWTEELTRYLFIWLVYISCSYAIKLDKHIKIDAVMLLFKKRGQFVLNICSNLLFLAFAAVMSHQGYLMVYRITVTQKQYSPAMGISMGIPYASIMAGSILMLIRLVQSTVRLVAEYSRPAVTALTAEEQKGY